MLRAVKRVIGYGLAGGVLIALLKVLEYKHFVPPGRAGVRRDGVRPHPVGGSTMRWRMA